MKRTYEQKVVNGHKYNMLGLPGTNFFKFEVINMYGSHIERIYKEKYGKNVYGISHFIEHLGFRATKDYPTTELLTLIKNEGSYNASTDYDRINYWFQTSMDRINLGINLVCNFTFNTLENIPADEFEIEKKVVYNEAKRYADDDQTMFYFNIAKSLAGYHTEDNVIGIPETIDTFTQEDAIRIKDIFMQSGENIFNVTYDSNILTADEVIEKIEAEMSRFKPAGIAEPIHYDEYRTGIIEPKKIVAKIDNESEQFMTYLNIDVVGNKMVADAGNAYLSAYAVDTSLNDVIREQNGLTYSISFGADNISYKPYTYFACDVTKGTETQLMELFKESINKSADAWSDEAYKKVMDTRELKRTMSLLDQKSYGGWHNTATWYPEIIEALAPILKEDVDAAYRIMDVEMITKEAIGEYLETVRTAVNNADYAIVTN